MGANASHGRDNESLMDKLVTAGYTLPSEVERAMRLVDRGSYFEEKSARAYVDLAWRSGSLHLSAPSIYMTALDNLDLQPGLHFLNVGSGSGYFSTIIGLILVDSSCFLCFPLSQRHHAHISWDAHMSSH
ncbi:unnamed protein product [Echinostoma caproni]|uniref:Protein-L-isoaspartate(D-aspartate) O-methyltransferase n=1 Tax=Echinostoma caproni TaxID=27848 RepID=A0A183B4E1_9TREM|nr:unnamed protein product [Echinostoma caproni]